MSIRFFGLIPAAGQGSRMGVDIPKQYLRLGSLTLLEHSVRALMSDRRVGQVLIVVAAADRHAAALSFPSGVTVAPVGGSCRAETVRNGLRVLADRIGAADRVLVHDAARPCLSATDLSSLIDAVGTQDAGGLLAEPLSDTLKRVDGAAVVETVERTGLWRAQTPQLFPFGILLRALEQCQDLDAVTDESSVVEQLGIRPRLVGATAVNLKVTTPADWPLAEAVLKAGGRW
ncbi:MAG TPA: 2-C-methyl-D-erythritol 4-phosphate cytidylyltransferase [Burkholderiaceae bacterium]|nr:2-C-methyl-D-erythritol 4-phosphate cytidylyltransferase [Burkholderiaceae bacterium]